MLRQDYGEPVAIAVFCAAVLREVSGLRKALCVCVCVFFFFWGGGGGPGFFVVVNRWVNFFWFL